MKTYIFVRNKKYRPSSYYRIYQYLDGINSGSLVLNEYEGDNYYQLKPEKKILQLLNKVFSGLIIGYIRRILFLVKVKLTRKEYNLFIQREIFPTAVGPLGRLLLSSVISQAKTVYWDFDDNIFESNEITEFERGLLFKKCNKIFVGNEFLKNKIVGKVIGKIEIVNTSDKMMENFPINAINDYRCSIYDNKVILIWVGTKSNIKFLENIIPELDEAAKKLPQKEIILKVVSNTTISQLTEKLTIENISWDREKAFEEMKIAHIGLMPLTENEFTKGKCAFKAVQSIGCALPVIVSDVGMNKAVVSNENGFLIKNKKNWVEAIVKLSSNKDLWLQKSQLSRDLFVKEFNPIKIKETVFKDISF